MELTVAELIELERIVEQTRAAELFEALVREYLAERGLVLPEKREKQEQRRTNDYYYRLGLNYYYRKEKENG